MTNRYVLGEKGERPWGSWEVVAGGVGYVVKRIVVFPGSRLSLQRHKHREEHWVVVAGDGVVTHDNELMPVVPGASVHLPLGCVHRVENTGRHDLVFIEVQRGDRLDEADIERFEDDYGRAVSTGATGVAVMV